MQTLVAIMENAPSGIHQTPRPLDFYVGNTNNECVGFFLTTVRPYNLVGKIESLFGMSNTDCSALLKLMGDSAVCSSAIRESLPPPPGQPPHKGVEESGELILLTALQNLCWLFGFLMKQTLCGATRTKR